MADEIGTGTTPRKVEKAGWLKPPFVGIVAFLAVFMIQPLGHIVMIVMEKIIVFGTPWTSIIFEGKPPAIPEGYENYALIDNSLYLSGFLVGVMGILIILWGVRKNTEIAGTWAGFAGASLLWTGWVEFSIHYYARFFGVKALCPDGSYAYACASKAATKPEYFLMQSSVGFMLVIMLYFLLNKETRCNMFRWFHRKLHMKVGAPSRGLTRNFANNVAIETLTILWFFYVYLMIVYDPVMAGDHSWVAYGSLIGLFLWSLYLIQRLLRFKRVSSALRYAIPTAIIFYNTIEIMGRMEWYTEFWVHPFKYPIPSILTILAVIGFAVMSILQATNKTKQIDQH